ncbi:hypothetical protein CGRA01v4_00960 [Colletotrichum graminicola]|nr:hypothetical protein CGRA01v4_00960 [Colletotrichum graminicola]
MNRNLSHLTSPLVIMSPNGPAHEATARETPYNDPRTRFVASQGEGSSKPLTALYSSGQRPRQSFYFPAKSSNDSLPLPHLPLREARACRLGNISSGSVMRLAGFRLICIVPATSMSEEYLSRPPCLLLRGRRGSRTLHERSKRQPACQSSAE